MLFQDHHPATDYIRNTMWRANYTHIRNRGKCVNTLDSWVRTLMSSQKVEPRFIHGFNNPSLGCLTALGSLLTVSIKLEFTSIPVRVNSFRLFCFGSKIKRCLFVFFFFGSSHIFPSVMIDSLNAHYYFYIMIN